MGKFQQWGLSTMAKQQKSLWIETLMSSHKLQLIHTMLSLNNMHFRNYSLFIYFLPACVFQPRFYVISYTTFIFMVPCITTLY